MSQLNKIRDVIEKVEEAYEYMLAYAAQGRAEEGGGPDGAQIRTFILQFLSAVQEISKTLDPIVEKTPETEAFIDHFRGESATMVAVLNAILARENISSEVIDNANGLISVRAYLTSLFFIDKAILS